MSSVEFWLWLIATETVMVAVSSRRNVQTWLVCFIVVAMISAIFLWYTWPYWSKGTIDDYIPHSK